jgi:ATPase subunit of ABC transporter with duplicated ATPase domains
MAIIATDLEYGYPGADSLFFDVSFKVDTGQHAALIGDNAVGKSTLLRVIAGHLQADEGTVAVDGSVLHMPQTIGQRDDPTTVREFLASLAAPRVRAAHTALADAEAANTSTPTEATGMRLAAAVGEWTDVHGFELEAVWDAACAAALRQPLARAGERPVTELSGGERKRLALEVLLGSDAEVLLLDEPDNFLDIPAKRWLERRIRQSQKTILVISHDRELLSHAVDRLVTIEGSGAWTHHGSFADYHEARDARNERLGDALQRWQQEERRLYRHYKVMKQRAALNDSNAARADAAETRWRRFVDIGPPPPPPPQRSVSIRLAGADSGRRVLRCADLELTGLTDPFSLDVYFQERVAVLGPNGSGKSHFLRLLGGEDIDHEGSFAHGARVEAGVFIQTADRSQFVGRTPLQVLGPAAGNEEAAMRYLARYGLQQAARRPFETLSGGQQARLQVLALELEGANLLLLDEPTDNLDLVSAEALQDALEEFTGTVVAVTHDRWFMRTFDRFVVFDLDGTVVEALGFEAAVGLVGDQTFEPGPGSVVALSG